MKNTTKKSFVLLGFLFMLIMALVGAIVMANRMSGTIATAASEVESGNEVSNLQAESTDKLTFTPITGESGETAYKVAIKTSFRASAQTIIIPRSYNNIPVTEIAANGFMSCAKLQKVIMPSSVKEIGSNAFMNCSKLEHVGMPAVEKIGNNAFARCPLLNGLYIPQTVQSVGMYVLQNNANRVYIQSSAETVNSTWSSTWSTYFTGETVYSVEPTDMLQYREIMDEQGVNVVGYELTEYQPLYTEDDIVIYNSVLVDEAIGYKPLLNICSEAFTFASANSITIKDMHADDTTAPVYSQKLNIRSNAFLCSFVNESIDIEVGVTFNHPNDLQVEPTISMYDAANIISDGEGRSARVFEMSYTQSITLPADLDVIPDAMFKDCAYLSSIKIAGQSYNGANQLPNVTEIGDSVFSSCCNIENITIGNSVTEMGDSVFLLWGDGLDDTTGTKKTQTINIDIYEDELPNGWNANWKSGITTNVVINYKALTQVTLNWQNETEDTEVISFKLGQAMPSLSVPTRAGYVFRGIYSERNGCGIQYYTNSMVNVRTWQEGDALTLYAYWTEGSYTVMLDDGTDLRTVNARYGFPMPAAAMPERDGYMFNGFYFEEQDGTKIYYYNSNMGSERDWDRTYNATLTADWEVIIYSIRYLNVSASENPSSNPTTYTIESPTIVFDAPTGRVGYEGSWNFGSIPQGSIGDITITAVWTPIVYNITYEIGEGYVNPSTNPTTYTIESPTINFAAPTGRTGYIGSWNPSSIPQGSTGNKTITAVWTPIIYNITYKNVLPSENPSSNPTTYTIESPTIVFDAPMGRTGYAVYWNPSSIPHGSTGNKTITAVWTPIIYNITYKNVLPSENPSSNPTTYTIESPTIVFDAPAGRTGYTVSWNPGSIPQGSTGNKTVTAVWTPIVYSIEYKNLLNGTHSGNPTTYTIESATIAFSNPIRAGYSGTWNINGIPQGSTGNKLITAVWSDPIRYKITYTNLEGGKYTNPDTYTVEDEITFNNPTGRTGYTGAWHISGIPKGSTGSIIVIAEWTPIKYTITYTNLQGADNHYNRTIYTIEDEFTFHSPYRIGYSATWNIKGISKGTTGNKTVTATWMLIEYTITYTNLQGADNHYNRTTYTIEDEFTFQSPYRIGYSATWNIKGISKGTTGNKTVTATWTLIEYTITYKNLYDRFTGATAYLPKAPSTYTYGTVINFAQYRPSFGYGVSSNLEFNGFFADSQFKTPMPNITANDYGNRTVYIKWNLQLGTKYGSGMRITDQGYDKNPSVGIYLGLGSRYKIEDLQAYGFTTVTIQINLTYKEIDDGYQHIRLISDKGTLYGPIDLECDTEERTFNTSLVFNLSDLQNIDFLDLQFDASGWGSDTWEIINYTVGVKFVV